MPLSYNEGFQVASLVAIECAVCVTDDVQDVEGMKHFADHGAREENCTGLIMEPEKRTAPDSRMLPEGIVPR